MAVVSLDMVKHIDKLTAGIAKYWGLRIQLKGCPTADLHLKKDGWDSADVDRALLTCYLTFHLTYILTLKYYLPFFWHSIQHFIWQSVRRFTSHRHYATWHFIWHIFWFCIWHAILIYSDTLPGIHHLALRAYNGPVSWQAHHGDRHQLGNGYGMAWLLYC